MEHITTLNEVRVIGNITINLASYYVFHQAQEGLQDTIPLFIIQGRN